MKSTLIFLTLLYAAQAQAMSLQDYLAAPANPVKIAVASGGEKVTRKIVAAVGGSLQLATTGGDSFELILPPRSLPRDTEISLQKVTVTHPGLSPSASYSSVEISPSGIQLGAPATLIFKPKHAFSTPSLTPFSAQADGDETHLALLLGTPAPTEIRLGLTHFSSYTISEAPTAEEIIAHGLSRDAATRVGNWLAWQILDARKNGGDFAGVMEKSFQEAFTTSVLPSLRAADSCASGKYALDSYLDWERELQLLGGTAEDFFPAGFKLDLGMLLTKSADQCFELAKKACYEDHQPIEVMNYAISFMRKGDLLGAPNVVRKFSELATKCSKFRFFLESEIWAGEARPDSMGVTVKADFPFSFDPVNGEPIEGDLDVESIYLNFSEMRCERTAQETRPSKLWLGNFLIANPGDRNDMTVLLGGLDPYSFATFRCEDLHDPETVISMNVPGAPTGSHWGGMFMATHGPTGVNEYRPELGMYVISGWQLRHDTRYAAKEYSRSVDGLNETTSIVIYHTPEAL